MRHPSATAALLATAVIGAAALLPAPVATAQARTGPASVRAAYLPSCPDKKIPDISGPCGHWRLLLRDGRYLTVGDAATSVTDDNGREIDYLSKFDVSADGRVVAYWRARDHRLVVRRVGGPATVLPAGLRPKGFGTLSLQIELSPTGDKLLIDYADRPNRLPTKVVTVATGKVTELPAAADALEFSGDGDEVLATRWETDRITTLYAYPLDGSAPVGGTLPRVVADAYTEALAPDGKTLAWVTRGDPEEKLPSRVRLYDLDSGDSSPAVDLPLRGNEVPNLLRYAPDGTLQVLTVSGKEGTPLVVRELDIDPLGDGLLSGDVRQSDRYSITDHRHEYYAGGE
ncbi:hypothetical protein SAMN05216276_101757 [Streptosporangium subroseum]|uniref:WD40-like Beta Propeller Repeat n=1 Tax=Streptosporangium subroseum TaxID=106412 RepID=A0A239HRH2_9ACTN|nr:hypothetical protein [Streptosporangium subroseum]SNS82894.1 hypothetical protein SAMN05216276_101757 [Streptosporangium subroseum]